MVLFGDQTAKIYEVQDDGYSIPYRVSIADYWAGEAKVGLLRPNHIWMYYDTLNGGLPIEVLPQTGTLNGEILELEMNQELTFGRFEGTELIERTIIANMHFFRVRMDRATEMISFEVEQTMNGYFLINFTQSLPQYVFINETVVRFY